jgi:predicted neuraminidase
MKISIFSALVAFAPLIASVPEWVVKEEYLSPAREQFDTHSSSIAETEDGKLCAVWKGGSGEGQSNINMKKNVGIWISLFDGRSWSEPTEVVSNPDSVCWNPTLTRLPSGELVLFYHVGPTSHHTLNLIIRSADGGKTWSEPELLPAGVVGPTKNKPIVTQSGKWICPSSSIIGKPEDRFKSAVVWIDIAEESGKKWRKVGPLTIPGKPFGVIEPTLFSDGKGGIKMLCRDRAYKMGEKGYIWTATSQDEGETWTELKPTTLPNPDAAFDAVDLGQGKIVLFYNHSHTDRHPLHCAVSLDGGETWSAPMILEEASGEFPAAILSSDGLIHVTYAIYKPGHNQRRIKHVVINPKLI